MSKNEAETSQRRKGHRKRRPFQKTLKTYLATWPASASASTLAFSPPLCTVLPMKRRWWIAAIVAMTVWPTVGHADNLAKEIKKAVERSTLDQPGAKSFHLKAVLAPSFERDKESGRTGE